VGKGREKLMQCGWGEKDRKPGFCPYSQLDIEKIGLGVEKGKRGGSANDKRGIKKREGKPLRVK